MFFFFFPFFSLLFPTTLPAPTQASFGRGWEQQQQSLGAAQDPSCVPLLTSPDKICVRQLCWRMKSELPVVWESTRVGSAAVCIGPGAGWAWAGLPGAPMEHRVQGPCGGSCASPSPVPAGPLWPHFSAPRGQHFQRARALRSPALCLQEGWVPPFPEPS